MTKQITFKSTPENWKKEYLGLKRNTVREFKEKGDLRQEIILEYIREELNLLNVVIVNTRTKEEFTRSVTDVTGFNDLYIISW